MLSRGASDASSRLKRSKSSGSVYRRRNESVVNQTIDPETSRQHAITAAHVAMDRANERQSVEIRRSADLSRTHSAASHTCTRPTPCSPNNRSRESAVPRRRRSTLQSKSLASSSTAHTPGSRPYSYVFDGVTRPPLNEFGVVDGYGSTPSSYRKLRKTRSLLTPRKCAQTVQGLASQSFNTPRTLRNVRSTPGDHDHGLRLGLKHSMSFLKLSSSNLSRTFKRSPGRYEHNDAGIDRVRDQFMFDVAQQKLHSKQSFFSTPGLRQQKSFRKTVRPDKATEGGEVACLEIQHTRPGSRLRSFSASLRARVRRVLGRSSVKEGSFPAQQLDATRPHFKDYLGGTDADVYNEEDETKDLPTSRDSFYVPSSQELSTMEDLEAISKSLSSIHSSDSLRSNGRSRVTSWTNSAMTNSLPCRATPLERKRLSIIQEHGGPYQPSSSIGRHLGEVSTGQLPLNARHGNVRFTSPIDSQRIYSALVKRIDQEQEALEGAKTPTAVAGQASSQAFACSAHSPQTAPTIRQVTSKESMCTVAPYQQDCQHGLQAPLLHVPKGKSPQEVAEENERMEKWKSGITLPERQSSFYPLSSEDRLPTASPLQLALASHRKQQQQQQTNSSDDEEGSVLVHRLSQEDNAVLETCSESQYSRTSSGQLLAAGVNTSEPDQVHEPAGMASIIPHQVNRYSRSGPPMAPFHNKANSNVSVEWKAWMNSQIGDLHRSDSLSSATHHREGAQIDGDDTAVGGRIGSAAGLGRRYAGRLAAEALELSKHERGAPKAKERFPLLELKEAQKSGWRSNMVGLPSSAGKTTKRTSLTALGRGANDENAGMLSLVGDDGDGLHENPSRPLAFGDSEEPEQPVSTPGRLQRRSHPSLQDQTLAKARSSTVTGHQHTRISETSADGDEWTPFRAGAQQNRVAALTDTALPPVRSGAKARKRHLRTGLGLGTGMGIGMGLSSKRMVSNFLKSRRRNQTTDAGNATTTQERAFSNSGQHVQDEEVEEEEEEWLSPAFV